MTRDEAFMVVEYHSAIHYNGCSKSVGPRGGVTTKIERYRPASQVKTWKRSPERFAFTVKFGMSPRTYEINESNCAQFHLEAACPLNQ